MAMALSPHHHPARSESNHHAPTTPATHTSEQKQHVSLGPLFSPPGRAEPQYKQNIEAALVKAGGVGTPSRLTNLSVFPSEERKINICIKPYMSPTNKKGETHFPGGEIHFTLFKCRSFSQVTCRGILLTGMIIFNCHDVFETRQWGATQEEGRGKKRERKGRWEKRERKGGERTWGPRFREILLLPSIVSSDTVRQARCYNEPPLCSTSSGEIRR